MAAQSTIPWKVENSSTSTIPAVSFEDVMSQQLADQLQAEEQHSINFLTLDERTSLASAEASSSTIQSSLHGSGSDFQTAQEMLQNSHNDFDCENDELLARLLQQEYDAQLKREEFELKQKATASFDEAFLEPEGYTSSEEDEETFDWDSFQNYSKAVKAGGIITNHDIDICGRRNASKVMELPSEIATGDGGSFDMKLSNNVYSALKQHSISEGKRSTRLHEKKEKSTTEQVMDAKSKLLVLKMLNRGILNEVNGSVASGKESSVYHGIGGNEEKNIATQEVAIKIFKTTLNEFKKRDPYVIGDFRLSTQHKFKKLNPRRFVHLWAEKEMHNLIRIKNAGIHCPEVVLLKKHILVMTFIGQDSKRAPTLKETNLSDSELRHAWKEVVEIMQKLWHKCDLVHADLSEYNLMWHLNRVWLIDVSQSVLTTHPRSMEFLLRDCRNIHNFFKRNGLDEVLSPTELFTKITGKTLSAHSSEDIELLQKIGSYEKDRELLTNDGSEKVDSFAEMFEKCQTASSESEKAPSEQLLAK